MVGRKERHGAVRRASLFVTIDPMDTKTILITGGAGFIGSHLIKKYLDEGHRVICLDNLQTTRTPRNLVAFVSHEHFTFVRQDVIVPYRSKERIDWIFNFACSGSYTSYQYDPVHTMKTNTVGVINMLELAREHGARIMQASTSEIYGDPLEVPQRESYKGNVNTLGPRACYDEGKRAAETLCMDYHREHGTDVKIIRIFNTYGPNMDQNDGRAVTNFVMNAIDGKDITIYGDGSATRSFQYIDDLVMGIDLMMKKDDFIGPVNLGNPGEITMKDLAEKVIAVTGSASQLHFEQGATDDPQRRCPDITLADVKLGWKPKVNLEDGLDKTIAYFRALSRPERKVLVFATTYLPHIGPAEEVLKELSEEMPETSFHFVTTRFSRTSTPFESTGTDRIYRIGFGSRFDKYLLPILGVLKARALHKENEYTFVWAVMGSYAGVAARLLKYLDPNLILFVTLDDTEFERAGALKRAVHRFVISGADTVFGESEAETHSRLMSQLPFVSYHEGNAKSFVKRVRKTYAERLNMRAHKLSRPK